MGAAARRCRGDELVMRNLKADAAVVGAGPAGSAAAFHLARLGARVVLVDRAVFPRPKVCGDGLTPRALAAIEAMGATPDLGPLTRLPRLATIDLGTGDCHYGPVPSLTQNHSWATVVSRTILDDALRRAAERAGATFLSATRVRELEGIGTVITGFRADGPGGPLHVTAGATVLAVGAAEHVTRSVRTGTRLNPVGLAIRQYFGLRAPLEPALRIYVPLVVEDAPLCGYGWVFPINDELANVGVGYFLAGDEAPRVRLRRLFHCFLQSLERVEPRVAVAGQCGAAQGGFIKAGMFPGEGAVGGAVLVGDALGAANPFTGEGIAQALDSGRIAAEAVHDHLSGRCPIEVGYAERLREAFPHRNDWLEWLPWLADRGGFRMREFWEVVSGRVGSAGRGLRAIALEEKPPAAALAGADQHLVQKSWAKAEEIIRSRNPMLAKLLSSVREAHAREAGGVLAEYWKQAREHGEGLDVPLALLTLAVLVAGDVGEGEGSLATGRLSPRGRWAVDALSLGTTDVLVAETFGSLAGLTPAEASLFARAAQSVFAEALWHNVPGGSHARRKPLRTLTPVAAMIGAELRRGAGISCGGVSLGAV
jgi:geranylgeranyl reductase family protein